MGWVKKALYVGVSLSALLTTFIGFDNNLQQAVASQHRFQFNVPYNCELVKNLVDQKNLSVGVYEHTLDGLPSTISATTMDDLGANVNKALNSIGIGVDLHHRRIEDVLDEFEQQILDKVRAENDEWLRNRAQYRSARPEVNWVSSDGTTFGESDAQAVSNSLQTKKDDLNEFRQDVLVAFAGEFPSRVGFSAAFKDGNEHVFPINLMKRKDDIVILLYDRPNNDSLINVQELGSVDVFGIISVDYKHDNGELRSIREMTPPIVHEIGHMVGLNHSTFVPDVMGYSIPVDLLINKFPALSFGPESRIEFSHIKNKCQTSNSAPPPVVQVPQFSALQYIRDSQNYGFFQKHGYSRTPPKSFGMKGV